MVLFGNPVSGRPEVYFTEQTLLKVEHEVYNPQLSQGNGQVAKLLPNPINLSSRSVRIGIGSTLQDTDLTFGNTIFSTAVMPLVTSSQKQVLPLEHLTSSTLVLVSHLLLIS